MELKPDFEHGLTDDEIKMFDKLAAMEEVHNALGALLSQYREEIITLRNQFVSHVARKYKFERPNQVAFDRSSKKIVSIFHPRLKASKIVLSRDNALNVVASQLLIDAIKQLTEVQKATKGN